MYNVNKILRENLINSEVVVPTQLYLEAGAVNIILLDAAIAVAKICNTDVDMSVLSKKFDLDQSKDIAGNIGQVVEWFKNHFSEQLDVVESCDDSDKELLENEMRRLYGILFDDTYNLETGDLSILIGVDIDDDKEKAVKAELCELYDELIIELAIACVPELEQKLQQQQSQQSQQQPPQSQQQGRPFIYYGYTPQIVNMNFIITDVVKVHDINEEAELADMLNKISAKLNIGEVFAITQYTDPHHFTAEKLGANNLPIPETDSAYKLILVVSEHTIKIKTNKTKKLRKRSIK